MGFMFVKYHPDRVTPEDFGYKVTEVKQATDEDVADLYRKAKEMSGNTIPQLEKCLSASSTLGETAVKNVLPRTKRPIKRT